MRVLAFSPGHITGFFEICRGGDEISTGSRGAGFSLSLGSYAEVKGSKEMIIEGNMGEGEVTRDALHILGIKNVRVKIRNQMPLSQGFGMSASSTLAATLATCHLLSLPYERALEAAHVAEVRMGGGLGDAIASFYGGLEMRLAPGLKGRIKVVEERARILVAVVGEPIKTRGIIENGEMVERINEEGREAMKSFLREPTFDNLALLSREFAISTGIADERMKRILRNGERIGSIGMCMLGNAVFAEYSKEMRRFLSGFQHYECFIDNGGARILASLFP